MIDKCPICGGPAGHTWHEAYSTDSSFPYVGCEQCEIMLPYSEYNEPDKERAERLWDTIATALLKQNGA